MIKEHFIYLLSFLLLITGLWGIIVSNNLVKQLLSLGIFQTSILIFFVAIGKIYGGVSPIISCHSCQDITYSNPLPSVLMLTAIVVGVATLAVGLALVIRIKFSFKTIERDNVEL